MEQHYRIYNKTSEKCGERLYGENDMFDKKTLLKSVIMENRWNVGDEIYLVNDSGVFLNLYSLIPPPLFKTKKESRKYLRRFRRYKKIYMKIKKEDSSDFSKMQDLMYDNMELNDKLMQHNFNAALNKLSVQVKGPTEESLTITYLQEELQKYIKINESLFEKNGELMREIDHLINTAIGKVQDQ